jgi:alkylhydroperoxidase family enzyme
MMLLRTVEPGQATGSVAKAYAAFDQAGEVPLPIRLLSASPGLQERQLALVGYYMSHPRLGFALLTAIRYVAAELSSHDACVAFNRGLLTRVGMSSEEIASLARGERAVALEEREAALLAFVRQALRAPQSVTAQEVEALRQLGWSDSDILDAVAHGTNIVAASALHKAFVRSDGATH